MLAVHAKLGANGATSAPTAANQQQQQQQQGGLLAALAGLGGAHEAMSGSMEEALAASTTQLMRALVAVRGGAAAALAHVHACACFCVCVLSLHTLGAWRACACAKVETSSASPRVVGNQVLSSGAGNAQRIG